MIHRMTSGHEFYGKPEVGQFALCYWRLTGRIRDIWYRTPHENAQWTPVPSLDVAEEIMKCDDYFQAVAILRASTKS